MANPSANDPPLPVGSGVGGSNHWKMERLVSVATLPLLGSLLVMDSNAVVNFGLAFVLPVHTQMGFECIIDDYLPARRVGDLLHLLVKWGTRAAAALTVYGLFLFNTNDMGVGNFLQDLWTVKKKRVE
jgi:succinate dehydrogenase (ubiquinone) membrane anchor subunit